VIYAAANAATTKSVYYKFHMHQRSDIVETNGSYTIHPCVLQHGDGVVVRRGSSMIGCQSLD
jgi:hypothetical protein